MKTDKFFKINIKDVYVIGDCANFDEVVNNSININLFILSGVIVFLFFVRFLAVKTSQRNLLNDRTKID